MTIDSDRLRVYTVWEPILRTDNAASAAKSHALLDDPRVIQYWTDTRDLGVAFQNPIGLDSEPA